jgi:NAD(P)-dependent dehydrogenase (short-subunit alcohol dehydrogenase family)
MQKPEPKRLILITGAAGGIGKEIVKEFIRFEYIVIAIDRVDQPEDLMCSYYVQSDLDYFVRDVEYSDRVLCEIKKIIGQNGLFALVNNAAIQILGGADSLTRENWKQTLNVNLLAPFHLSQALLSDLEKVNGCIVNISSIHAKLTKKNFLAYSTSKAAMSSMTKAMAVDLGGRVRVNAIEPAAIETDMLKSGFSNSPDRYKMLAEYHPAGIIGSAIELSKLVRSIVEIDSSFFTGEVIAFDGGIGSVLHDPS